MTSTNITSTLGIPLVSYKSLGPTRIEVPPLVDDTAADTTATPLTKVAEQHRAGNEVDRVPGGAEVSLHKIDTRGSGPASRAPRVVIPDDETTCDRDTTHLLHRDVRTAPDVAEPTVK